MVLQRGNPAAGHSGGAQNTVRLARANGLENKPSPLIFQSACPAQCFSLFGIFTGFLGKLSQPDETSAIVTYGAEPMFYVIGATAALLKDCNVAIVECRPGRELEWHHYVKRHLSPDCIAPCVVRSEGRAQ
jgi:hypothetical protein